jgi:uncharacterized RDD family membrane protein YckC
METVDETLLARIIAFVVDSILVGIVGGLLVGIATAVSPRLASFLTLPFGLLGLLYWVYFEGAYGQTLGKMAMDVVVVKDDGSDCDYAASLVRNVLRIVDALPTFYIVGLVVIYVSDEGQRVGDIAASTVVVNERGA